MVEAATLLRYDTRFTAYTADTALALSTALVALVIKSSGAYSPNALLRLLQLAGVDEAVAFTLLGRIWLALSGVVTLLLLTRFLSRAQQGFYFTFADVLGLQVFFELGLAHVLVQFASHERAGLEWTSEGILEGDPVCKARLASLLGMIVKWYGVITILLVAALLPGGALYFHRFGVHYRNVAWQLPWVWIVIVTAGSLALSPLLALLEGCGLIARIARIQLLQNMVGSGLFWTALVHHWGLYTVPITNTSVFFGGACWLWLTKRRFFADLWGCRSAGSGSADGIVWKQEVWPLQWKIALSWLSGYFIFRLFNPLMFAFFGPVVAGRMGLSLTAVNALAGISVSWVNTKSSPFGMLIARREFAELDRRFFPCLWQSLIFLVCSALVVWLATFALFASGNPLSLRILEPLPMALLLGAVIATHVVYCEAIYLRAHKQEPFLVMSLIWGGLILLSSITLGREFGATGMMLGYFVINLVVGTGAGTWIFVRKRTEWHAPSA